MFSGQQSQNPLLLLGQYSDDEADERSNKGPNDTKVHSHEEVLIVLSTDLFLAKSLMFSTRYVSYSRVCVFVLGFVVMFMILIISVIKSDK